MQSTLTKIIYILIAVLITGGLIAVVWFGLTRPSTPSSSTQTQYSSTSYNNQTTVTPTNNTTTQNQTTSQTQQPLDIPTAYAQLFQSLSAQPAAFVVVGATSTGDAAALYGLYASDISIAKSYDSNSAHLTVEVALVDITDDGTPEALVYENLPGFCGSAGCALDIYQKENGKWIKISSMSASDDEVGLSNVLTSGYLDLFVTVPGAVGSEPHVMHYVWNGSNYKSKQAVAVWYGGQFVLLQ